MLQVRGQKSPNALGTCGIWCGFFVASGSDRVKNYARVGDSTPRPCTFTQAVLYMALSALGCCTLLSKFFDRIIEGNFIQPSEPLSCRLRCEARKEGNYYVPGDPKLAFVMRIRGINQVKYNHVETFKIPPSHAP